MDGKREYRIVINGIEENIKAIDSLVKQLDGLDARIRELENRTINIKVNSQDVKIPTVQVSSDGGNSTSTLQEEVALQKELNNLKNEGTRLDAKIAASQTEIFQKVDATKQLYKETLADQKAIAAQERLTANAYSNTMQGMKQQLADLKAVINTTDLGDSDQIKKMTEDAKVLTDKLKEMEAAYGTFGRNVGNYQDAANGFKGIAIAVGDTTKEFDNAKQALKELKKERDTLAVKQDLGIISKEEADRLKELIPTVAQLQSAIQDAGKPMDALMDTMQSFVAVAQSFKGIGAFFGFDNAEVEQTIKKLVALQNAMQGLQTIQKQINSREGIGAWIAPFTSSIDKATTKLLTFNTALLGTGRASKVAALGVKAFGTALKAALSFGVLLVVNLVIEGLEKLWDWFNKDKKAAEELRKEQQELSKTYGDAAAKISFYENKIRNFNGTRKQEKKLVEELNSALGKGLGTYKTLAQWKDVLTKNGKAYCQMLVMEAKVQQLVTKAAAAYLNLENQFEYKNGRRILKNVQGYKDAMAEVQKIEKQLEKAMGEADTYSKDHKLGNYAPQIEKNEKKSSDALKKEQETLNNLELKLMKDGLAKRLKQLDNEEKKTVEEIKKNGKKSASAVTQVQEDYMKLKQKEIDAYMENLNQTIIKTSDSISSIKLQLDDEELKNQIEEIKQELEKLKLDNLEYDQFEPAMDILDRLKEKVKKSGGKLKLDILWDLEGETLPSELEGILGGIDEYKAEVIDQMTSLYDEMYELQNNALKVEQDKLEEAEAKRYETEITALDKEREILDADITAYKNRADMNVDTLTEMYAKLDDILNNIELANKNHEDKCNEITKEGQNKRRELYRENRVALSQINEQYFSETEDTLSEFLTAVDDLLSRAYRKNDFQIINISRTNQNLKEAKEAVQDAMNEIMRQRSLASKAWDDGLLTPEAYNAIIKQLNGLEMQFRATGAQIDYESKQMIAKFVDSMMPYINGVMDAFQTIMDGIWDAEDAAFDREQEQIEKENKAIEDALSKQEDIVEQHKNAIDEIEDELSSARGARRQHLIDQINAEIAAQRAAQKEQEKLDRKKQANERKQEDLEKKRKKAEYDRQILQAIVNGAMAVTYAAMNTWPTPAIPLMALAAATTAAQVAMMKANKPYAKGGLLEGASHKEGGIPVGNTGIEVEGKEYIIRKESTTPNVELLDYINSKKRRMSLDDFIDFYTSGKLKSNIKSISPSTKFADGGQLTLDTSNIDFNDKLLDAFEAYSRRPLYVAVTDIERKQNDLNQVRALAGVQ